MANMRLLCKQPYLDYATKSVANVGAKHPHLPPARDGASEAPLHQIVDQIFEIRVLILCVGSMRLLCLE